VATYLPGEPGCQDPVSQNFHVQTQEWRCDTGNVVCNPHSILKLQATSAVWPWGSIMAGIANHPTQLVHGADGRIMLAKDTQLTKRDGAMQH
jgi:hypothetical protein